jgi:hypothetical protein
VPDFREGLKTRAGNQKTERVKLSNKFRESTPKTWETCDRLSRQSEVVPGLRLLPLSRFVV